MNENLKQVIFSRDANMTIQTHSLQRDILVEYFNIQSKSKQPIEITSEQERLGFFVCLSGENRITLQETRDTIYIRKGVCGAYHEPKGLLNKAVYNPFEPFRILSITMPPGTLGSIFSKEANTLLKLSGKNNKFSNRSYAFRCFAVQPLINTVVSQIFNPPVTPDFFPTYLEGKVLEIISLMLQTLRTHETCLDFSSSFNAVETANLLKARSLLGKDLETPPSPIEIAGQCSLSINRMNRGFKELFGQTISQYLRDCRMEKARILLTSGECNVTEACFQVGYSNLSHFAKLYRNYFGYSPVKDRKQFFQVP